MKKIIAIIITISLIALLEATEISLGASLDTFEPNKRGAFGFNAHISAPLTPNINLFTNLESLGGKTYQTNVSIEHIFFPFWSIDYGLDLFIKQESIIPAFHFNTILSPSSVYKIQIGTKLELNPLDVLYPNSLIFSLKNNIITEQVLSIIYLGYKRNLNQNIQYDQLILDFAFSSNNKTPPFNLGVIADTTINIPQAKALFNIVTNVGIKVNFVRKARPFEFSVKVEVLDIKNNTKYPFIMVLSTKL